MQSLIIRGLLAPLDGLLDPIRAHISSAEEIRNTLRQWLAAAVPDSTAPCAIVGPDWATSALLDVMHDAGRDVIGVFTPNAGEEGTWRFGERLRPLADLANEPVTYVVAGSDARIRERLADAGCAAAVYVIDASQASPVAADAELDGLRRAQARDLAAGRIDKMLARLPLLQVLEGERGWPHWYATARACEREEQPDDALRLYREVMTECRTDIALCMRATFDVARLLIEREESLQAVPLLKSVLFHNPGHRAARELLDDVQIEMTTLSKVAV